MTTCWTISTAPTRPADLPDNWLDPSERTRCARRDACSRSAAPGCCPAAAYTSPQVLAWEKRYLFAGTWTCVGREADLRAAPGAEAAVHAAGARRRRRARGAHLGRRRHPRVRATPAGTARTSCCREGETDDKRFVVCPYHAWSYKLDGTLKNAPATRSSRASTPTEYGLVELPVERWQGWVFVHAANSIADGGAPVRSRTHLGDMAGLVEPYDVDSSTWRPAQLRGERQLEGDHRELPRVLPLPEHPPGALRGHAADLRRQLRTARRLGRRLDGPARRHGDDVDHRQVRRRPAARRRARRRCCTSGCGRTCWSRRTRTTCSPTG